MNTSHVFGETEPFADMLQGGNEVVVAHNSKYDEKINQEENIQSQA